MRNCNAIQFNGNLNGNLNKITRYIGYLLSSLKCYIPYHWLIIVCGTGPIADWSTACLLITLNYYISLVKRVKIWHTLYVLLLLVPSRNLKSLGSIKECLGSINESLGSIKESLGSIKERISLSHQGIPWFHQWISWFHKWIYRLVRSRNLFVL